MKQNKISRNYFINPSFTHSLYLVALALIITILCAQSGWEWYWISSLALCTLATWIMQQEIKKATSTALLLSCCSLFSFYYQWYDYHSDSFFLQRPVNIEGIVENIDRNTLIDDKTSITLQCSSIKLPYWKKETAFTKKIMIFVPTKLIVEPPQLAQQITLRNVRISQPEPTIDYTKYLVKEGIWATCHLYQNHIILGKQNAPSLQQKTLQRIFHVLPQEAHSLYQSLFLGKREKDLETVALQQKATFWGAAHHMARSGVHLSALIILLLLLLKLTSLPWFLQQLLSSIALVFYSIISFPTVSFLRSLIMVLCHIIGRSFFIPTTSLHVFIITTLIILIANPMHLFYLDFQLSFGVTMIIIWFFQSKRLQTIAFAQK